MIRYFCLFHFSGFRIFSIPKCEDELIPLKVDNSNVPDEVKVVYDYREKLVYKRVGESRLLLMVLEIKSIQTDSDGQPVPSAFIVLGENEDKEQMDNIAKRISSNVNEFDIFFKNLFTLKDGLHIEGKELFSWIAETKKYEAVPLKSNPEQKVVIGPFELEPKNIDEDCDSSDSKKKLAIVLLVLFLIVLSMIVMTRQK